MFKRVLALACAALITLAPNIALAQSASTQGNDGSPTASGGVRLLGSDGTNDYRLQTDASGRLQPLPGFPVYDVIAHRSNVTITTAAPNDSSAVPFPTEKYKQMYALLRIKAATFSATGYLELAVRSSAAAQLDSTALGWWYPIGTGQRLGKTVRLVTLTDRWKMIPFSDSLTSAPFFSPYTGIYISNFTGAQVIIDYWVLGVR